VTEQRSKIKTLKAVFLCTKLGIVKRFSVVSDDHAIATVCGGGATGERMVTLSRSEIVTSLED
jgi:hypothetical protein